MDGSERERDGERENVEEEDWEVNSRVRAFPPSCPGMEASSRRAMQNSVSRSHSSGLKVTNHAFS